MIAMIAGSVGMEFDASGDHGDGIDTVKPLSGWWAYRKKEDALIDGQPSQETEKMAEEDLVARLAKKSLIEQARRKMWAEIKVRW